MKMRKTGFLFLYLLITACEEPIQAPLMPGSLDVLVVEGIMTSENIGHRIKLAHPITAQNEIPEPVSGATLTITEGSNTYSLTESPAGAGLYYTPPLRAVAGKTYVLSIQYQGKKYSAEDTPVAVENMNPFSYQKSGDQFELTINSSGQAPNFIRHDISWAGTSACTTGNCIGEIIYYDLKSLDVNEIYKPAKETFTFPAGSVIIRTKYSLSTSYQAFLRAVLSETEWRGGVFDVQRAEVPTNLTEGAVGFFGVSTVVSDTTVVIE